jgi:hypothetical protein
VQFLARADEEFQFLATRVDKEVQFLATKEMRRFNFLTPFCSFSHLEDED